MNSPAHWNRILDRSLRGSALLLALWGVVTAAAAVWLSAATPEGPVPFPLDWIYWGSSAAGLALLLPGALLTVRLPRHWLAWLLILCGTSSLLAAFGAVYAPYSLLAHAGTLPFTGFFVFAGSRFGPIIHLVVPALLVLFPTGRPPGGRWRIPALVALVGMVVAVLFILAVPWSVFSEGEPLTPELAGFTLDVWQPRFLAEFWMWAGSGLFQVCAGVSLLTAIAVFVSRFRGADAERRAQLRWMLFAGAVTVGSMLATVVLQRAFGYAEGTLGWLVEAVFILENVLLSGAVIVAVTRYRLYDVDLLIGRTLLYGALAAAVVGIDLTVFIAVSGLVEDRLAGVMAAGVVAVLYSPLRVRLQRLVDRVLKGRDDPYDIVSVLARRLEESPGPDELLQETARGVASVFRSPYVRVELDRPDGTTMIVEEGMLREDVVLLPFAYRGVRIGRLALVPRPGLRGSELDQRLLADVVRQAAAATRATALTEELQRSREQLVTGVAEERRRLRRDLHDGLGPALAAAGLKIQAARNLARRDPAAADRTLVQVAGDLSVVLADVRRLVHDLRPPALDQFGLLGAIRQQAARFDVGRPSVRVVAEGNLDELPAAVEVAVFRIVSEALNNMARHAEATHCTVRLTVSDRAASDRGLSERGFSERSDSGRDASEQGLSGRDASGREGSARDASGRDASERGLSGREFSGREGSERGLSGRDASGREGSGREGSGRGDSGRGDSGWEGSGWEGAGREVWVEVRDDGRGVPPGALVGVGLVAMRERAEELGGHCVIEPVPGGGTLVSAVIPAMMEPTPAAQGAA